jgi:hypothetical protein
MTVSSKARTIRVKRLFGVVVLKVRNRADGLAQLNAVDPVFAQYVASKADDLICRHYTLWGYAWRALLPSCKMRRADWELQPDAWEQRIQARRVGSLN